MTHASILAEDRAKQATAEMRDSRSRVARFAQSFCALHAPTTSSLPNERLPVQGTRNARFSNMNFSRTTLILPLLLASAAAPTVANAAVCSDPNMIAERKTFVNKYLPGPDLHRKVKEARAALNGFDIRYTGDNDQSIWKLKINLITYKKGDDLPADLRGLPLHDNEVHVVAEFLLRDDDNIDGYAGWIDATVFAKLE